VKKNMEVNCKNGYEVIKENKSLQFSCLISGISETQHANYTRNPPVVQGCVVRMKQISAPDSMSGR
jgi:hypothetical protein